MDRLISIARRPQTIVAVVSEVVAGYHIGGAVPPFRERIEPLSAVSEALCPWKGKDVRAWRALGRVPELSPRACLAIVRALIGSVADPATLTRDLPPLSFAAGPADVRPYLCGHETEQALIDRIGEDLDRASEGTELPDWHWTHRAAIAELPAAFRASLLWGLHLSSWDQVLITLGMYDALGLEEDASLRSAVARLLSHADRAIGIDWCKVLCEVPPGARMHAAALVVASGGYATGPGEPVAELLVAARWNEAASALSTR